MLNRWKSWRRQRILQRHRIDAGAWESALAGLRSAAHLQSRDRHRLRDLASLFLVAKSIEAAGGVEITGDMRVRIAAECCIPILELSLDLYDPWYAVVLYPDEFIARHEYIDEAGVQHSVHDVRSGEAWEQGPVILSWEDIMRDEPGQSVIIHEMAHKLDLLDGSPNGFPPLHADMDPRRWSEAFSAAFEELRKKSDGGEWTEIDPYGAQDPAEFFAVVSEEFFVRPALLHREWPPVYEQLSRYYRQHPL